MKDLTKKIASFEPMTSDMNNFYSPIEVMDSKIYLFTNKEIDKSKVDYLFT